MKTTIVLSINPEHVRNIINGTKKFEYRTRIPKSDVNKILIYETKPIMRIVAEAEIIQVLMLSPDELWTKTKESSGITKDFFDEYFRNREVAYAYKLGKIKVYNEPKELQDFGLKTAPQSFAYID